MLFDSVEGKPALDGMFIKKFFEKYNSIKDLECNPGWELIKKYSTNEK